MIAAETVVWPDGRGGVWTSGERAAQEMKVFVEFQRTPRFTRLG